MLPSKAKYHRSQGRVFRLLSTMLSMLLLAACAAQMPAPEPAPKCDEVADEAVNQGNWELALKEHEQVLKEQPDNCLALYHLGYIWGQLGDREKEVHFYEAAVDCGYVHDDRLFFNLGMVYADTGDTQQALKALERATQLGPDNPDNFFGLGYTYLLAGRPAQAEAALITTLRLDDTHTDARLTLVRLYLDQSRWEDARRQLRRIKAGDPGYEAAQELWRKLEEREGAEYKGRNPR